MKFYHKALPVIYLATNALGVLALPGQSTESENVGLSSDGKISGSTGATVEVTLPLGTVVGSVSGVENFNGIPYAEPPVGQLRLKPPKKLTKPFGRFIATGTAASCPQMSLFGGSNAKPSNAEAQAAIALSPIFSPANTGEIKEDCLTITVQRPLGTKAGAGLPVFFWIYGGGFAFGSTSQYNGEHLMQFAKEKKKDFIFVAVNYRVAGWGFLGGKEIKADGSSNLGLLDQRLGLEWVADNIAAFGGDPNKVTIAGESAGAISVFDQLVLYEGNATYKGKPLFRAAIMNSGSATPVEPIDGDKAQAIYDGVVARAGCGGKSNTLACLREARYDVLAKAINAAPGIMSYSSLALSYLPRPDGKVLADAPDKLLRTGRYFGVPAIIGDQEDEGTLFAFSQTNVTSTEKLVGYFANIFFSRATKAEITDFVNTYPAASSAGSPFRTGNSFDLVYANWFGIIPVFVPGFKRMAAILGDMVFTLIRRLSIEIMVDVNPNVPVWSYLNSYYYDSGFKQVGTSHGSDIGKLFKQSDFSANSTRTYYLNFLHNQNPNNGGGVGNGNGEYPNWPLWKQNKQLLWVNATKIGLLNDNFRDASYQYMKANTSKLYF